MKVRVFSTSLGEVFDPREDFVSDEVIVLQRHPESQIEGATKGYADKKLEEFYKNPKINGTVKDVDKLQLKGPDITHSKDGLFLKNLHDSEQTGVMFDVDQYGRVTKVYQPTEENLDPSSTISWNQVTKKPTTLEGYGITDLAPSDRNVEVTGKLTVEYQPRSTKSPVPMGFLIDKFENSGYKLYPGVIVIKLRRLPIEDDDDWEDYPGEGGEWEDYPEDDDDLEDIEDDGWGYVDDSRWKRANGAIIYREDYPEAVTAIAGPEANYAALPDATEHDRILLETYGVDARTYILVK